MKTYTHASKCGNNAVNCSLRARWPKLTKKFSVSTCFTGPVSTAWSCSTAGGLSADEQKKLENYWKKFENYVKPHSNELIAAWELHNLRQGTLSLEEFIAKLRILVKEANYPSEHHDRFLRDFLVLGMNSDHVRKECFKEGNALTFSKAREMAKADESADKQLQLMNPVVSAVHPISSTRRNQFQSDQLNPKASGSRQNPKGNKSGKTQLCRNCCWGPHSHEQCPARNVTCHYCQKVGHLAKVCFSKLKKKDVHEIEATSNNNAIPESEPTQSLDDYVFLGPIEATPLAMRVNVVSCREKALLEVSLALKPEGKQLNALCKIDSGAETNIIPKSLYKQLSPETLSLQQPTVKLTAYGGAEIPNLGSCQIYVKGPNNSNPRVIQAEVVDVDGPAIIGNMSAQDLNLLKLNWPVTASTNATTQNVVQSEKPMPNANTVKLFDIRGKQHPFPLTKDYLLEEYQDVFTGIVCFPGPPYHIETNPDIPPVQHILTVPDTARENNVRFNPDKFQFQVKEASFFGLMINYLNRFSPILAQVSEPVRQLMKKDVPFVWQPEHQRAFQNLKQAITEVPVLAYYDPEKENLIQSDASLKGIGCVLTQEGKPVCYASRSLTETESRYSNIERELLATCWSLEKLNHYVFGKKVVIETDHKPLESIWKKSISSAPPRLQRLLLKMAKYNVQIRYIQGKSNVIADALSRISHMEPPAEDNEIPLVELDTISRTLPSSPAKLDEVREYTDQDVVLSHLKDVVHHGWPEYPNECPQDLKEFWNFREDLSVENGLILKGHKLVIPSKLRPQMLQIVHQGHMGTEKCLLRARDSPFWPGISRDIKQMTENCPTCAQFSKQQPKETLHPHNVPSYPWQRLGCDLFDYGGAQYLLAADYYSKYPIVRKLSSTTSAAIINHLKSIFAEHGIPESLVSDDGPQYSSKEFAAFCDQWGINHITSSPVYPKSNGFIERMVQTVKNLLRKSEAAGQDPYLALLSYRATPVDSNLPSPAKLLNNREYRTQLPSSGRLQRSQAKECHQDQLQHRQDVQKQLHDGKSTRELQKLVPGQPVSVFQPKTKTWTPATLKEQMNQPRSYIVQTNSGSELRRNRIQLKPSDQVAPSLEGQLLSSQLLSSQDNLTKSRHQDYPRHPRNQLQLVREVPTNI